MIRRPPRSTLFPTRRSSDLVNRTKDGLVDVPRCWHVLVSARPTCRALIGLRVDSTAKPRSRSQSTASGESVEPVLVEASAAAVRCKVAGDQRETFLTGGLTRSW